MSICPTWIALFGVPLSLCKDNQKGNISVPAQPTAMHLKSTHAQRTRTTTDGSIHFYLQDDMQLLIQPKSAAYPYPLSAVDTLALANLLIADYKAIATEAKKFNGIQRAGRKEER